MDDDQKYGLEGIERDQGFEKMPVSSPVDVPEPDHMTEHELSHLRRPEPPAPEVREYRSHGAAGDELDSKYTVSAEQAAHDVGNVRRAEREALEAERNRELDEALRAHEAGQQPQQPAQDQQATALDEPQPEAAEADAARAEVDAAWAQADEQISEFLKNPHIRERIEGSFNQVRAEADAKVAQGFAQVEQAKAAYVQHANALTGQLNALVLSNFPELQSVANDSQQLAGAVQLLAKTNPQRAQQLQDFVLRASTVAGQLEQQGQAHRQAQAAQQDQALTDYTNREIQRYEAWTERERADMGAVRENLAPVLQKHYGIDANQLKQIHDGKIAIDGARLLRSAEFQAVMTDAIRYRLAQQGVTQARTAVVPKVQRPGVASAGPTADPGEIAAASMRFNQPGGNIGRDGLRNAAALITAKRAGR